MIIVFISDKFSYENFLIHFTNLGSSEVTKCLFSCYFQYIIMKTNILGVEYTSIVKNYQFSNSNIYQKLLR